MCEFVDDIPSVATFSTLNNPHDGQIRTIRRPVFWFNELWHTGALVSVRLWHKWSMVLRPAEKRSDC